ncbi:hypothetical protein ACFWZO_26730, partial [Streptomyces sp. NPDC059015]
MPGDGRARSPSERGPARGPFDAAPFASGRSGNSNAMTNSSANNNGSGTTTRATKTAKATSAK